MKNNFPTALSEDELEVIHAILADADALAALSQKELIQLVLESELGDNLIVAELLNRLDPTWSDE